MNEQDHRMGTFSFGQPEISYYLKQTGFKDDFLQPGLLSLPSTRNDQ